MKYPILQEIGLSPNEAQIYEALLESNESGASEIAIKAKVHRRNVYDALHRLIEKGLVFQVFGKGEVNFRAVDPGKLLELVKEKEEKLQQIMPHLETSYRAEPRQQEVYIYKGIEGFKNYLRDILRVGEDVSFIGAKGGWFDPKLSVFVQGFLKEAERIGIKYKHLFDHEVKELPNITQTLKQPFRFLPKEYSTNAAVDIFGDHVVTFSGLKLSKLNEDVVLFVLVNKELADGYKTWFQFMWDNCKAEK